MDLRLFSCPLLMSGLSVLSNYGRSSPSSGLWVHCHPRRCRCTTVSSGPHWNLPLSCTLLEEVYHQNQGNFRRVWMFTLPPCLYQNNPVRDLDRLFLAVFSEQQQLIMDATGRALSFTSITLSSEVERKGSKIIGIVGIKLNLIPVQMISVSYFI